VVYAACLRAILFIFLVLPVWYLFHPGDALIGNAIWAVWSIYFGIAAAQFYSGNRFISWVKGAAAAALISPATSTLITAVSLAFERIRLS
jgi:hypothetical protein